MKSVLLISFLFLACGGAGENTSPTSADQDDSPPRSIPIFADANLGQAVASALSGEPPKTPQSLDKLEAQNRQIVDLNGIEALQNLTVLDLSDNQLQDIAPLTNLTKLTFLVLTGNQIEDISPLASLPQLAVVLLDGNAVRDISPLLDLPALNNVELAGNPLDEVSLNTHLATLRDRDVEVGLNVFANTPPEPDEPLQEEPGRIAFSVISGQGFHVHLIDANGENRVRLEDGADQDSEPAWAPDGRQLALVEGSPDGSIWAVEIDGIDPGTRRLIRRGGDNRSPAWSPDGSRIAFVSKPEGRGQTQIFTMAPDGSDIIQLTYADRPALEDKRAPAWSPNGRELALSADILPGAPASFRLFKMRLDGAAESFIQLTQDDGYAQDPAWSPDGRRIAFSRPDNSGGWRSSLVVVEADGSNSRELVSLPGTITDPSWAPIP